MSDIISEREIIVAEGSMTMYCYAQGDVFHENGNWYAHARDGTRVGDVYRSHKEAVEALLRAAGEAA
jgi:hypothetical protein